MARPVLRLSQFLLIVAMFAACGGHWLVLQSVAWGGMIVKYSQSSNLTIAVEKTFNGQHPCGLCKKIQTGKSKEQRPEIQIPISKMEFLASPSTPILMLKQEVVPMELVDTFSDPRDQAPSVRPPRQA